MKAELVITQVRALMKFYSDHPKNIQSISNKEWLKIKRGVFILLQHNKVETLDFTSVMKVLEVRFATHLGSLRSELAMNMIETKEPKTLKYLDISAVLNFYSECLEKNNYEFSSPEWVEIIGYLRPLEMERLWYNVNN